MNFIKERIGITWIVVIVCMWGWFVVDKGFEWTDLFVLPLMTILSILGIVIVNYAKPDVIITSNGFFGLLGAKLFWHIIAPIIAIFAVPMIILSIFNKASNPQATTLRKNYKIACSVEQIKKTGTLKCENAKKELLTLVNTELTINKEKYKTAQDNIVQSTKGKETKCSEQGLKEHGSEGCRLVTEDLNKNVSLVEELKKKIEGLENEIGDLKTK